MKGKLEVYKNYGMPNQELVMEDDNLIVDSAAEILIDLLSTPSSLYSTDLGTTVGTQAMFDASNYRIQAISFGKAEPQYHENAHKFKSAGRNLLSMTEYLDNSGIARIEYDRNLLSRNEGEEYYLFRADQDGLIILEGPDSTVSSSPEVSGFQRIPFGNASGALFFTSGLDETSPSAGFWVSTDRAFTIASGAASYDLSNTATTVELSSMPANRLVPASIRQAQGTGFGSGTISSVLNFDSFHNWDNVGADNNAYLGGTNDNIVVSAMNGSAAAGQNPRTLDPFGTNYANHVFFKADKDTQGGPFILNNLSGALDGSGFQVCSVHGKSTNWTLSLYYKLSATFPSYYTTYNGLNWEANSEPIEATINLGLSVSSFNMGNPGTENLDISGSNNFTSDKGWIPAASTPIADDTSGVWLVPNASTAPDGTNTAWRITQFGGDKDNEDLYPVEGAYVRIYKDYTTGDGLKFADTRGTPLGSELNNIGQSQGRAYAASIHVKMDTSAPWSTAADDNHTTLELYNDNNSGIRAKIYWNDDGTLKYIDQSEPPESGGACNECGVNGYTDYEDVGDGWYKVTLVAPFYGDVESGYVDILRWRVWPAGNWAGSNDSGGCYIWRSSITEVRKRTHSNSIVCPDYGFPANQPFLINQGTPVGLQRAYNWDPDQALNTMNLSAPISIGSGTPGEWKRIEKTFEFSAEPNILIPRINFSFVKEDQGLWISHMQLEPGTSASPWQDGSSLSIMKGLDRGTKDILKKPFAQFSNRNKPANNKPLLAGESTLNHELCYSVYVNPGDLKASDDADTVIRLKLVDGSGGPGNTPYTDTVLSPGTDAWARASHKTTFSSTNSDRLGIEMFLSGINPGTDFKLSNPQLEYTSFTLPENLSEINTGLDTPTEWMPRLNLSSMDVWNAESTVSAINFAASVVANVVAGPFPGTSGALVKNQYDGSSLSLQTRLHTFEHAADSVNNYSSVGWHEKPMTASVYLKYNFEDPVAITGDGYSDSNEFARRSEICLYPADDFRGNEVRYTWGSQLAIRWSDIWDGAGENPFLNNPGDGSATIDNLSYSELRANGGLEYINNGWYRASVTLSQPARIGDTATSALVFSIYPTWRREATFKNWPTAVGGSLYVYGPQLEIGDHPTEYQESNAFFGNTDTLYTYSAVNPEKDFPIRQRHDTDFSGTIDSSTLYLEYPYPAENASGANIVINPNYIQEESGSKWDLTDGQVTATRTTAIYPLNAGVDSSFKIVKGGDSVSFGGISQIIDPSSLRHGTNYTLSFYIRRIDQGTTPPGTIRVKLLQGTGGRYQAQARFDFDTSGFSLVAEIGKESIGVASVENVGEGYAADGNMWHKCRLTMPYNVYDTTGPAATLNILFVTPGNYDTGDTCYLSQVTLQPADVSSYTPNPYLPKDPNPRDVSIVEKYRPPMASALEFSSTFNQNVNFLAFRDNSALNVSSFKSVEIVPHVPQYMVTTEGPGTDTSGALGANALYFGCYPPASSLAPGTSPDPDTAAEYTPREATNINYVIVSSFDSSDAYLNSNLSGTYVGYFNQTSSMDPSGFVRAYQASDVMAGTKTYASGLIVSSEPTFSSTGEVIYVTQMASGDLGMANLYGGITQLGLWAYDMKQMVAEGKFPPYDFVPKDIDDPHNSSLLGDHLKYKLVCKKVLNRNLAEIFDTSGPGVYQYQDLTLVWRLNFTDTQLHSPPTP